MVHRNSTYDSEAYDLMKLYLRFWSLLFSSLDCLSQTLKHGPLGHCYTFIVDTVKQFIPNIKLLECKSADILLPWSKATPFCPWISIELKQNSPYVKKTSTEPPLAQSSKGTSHMPIYTAFPAPSLKTSPEGTTSRSFSVRILPVESPQNHTWKRHQQSHH